MSATNKVPQFVRYLRAHAKPFLESRHSLVQQHAKSINGRKPARFGGS